MITSKRNPNFLVSIVLSADKYKPRIEKLNPGNSIKGLMDTFLGLRKVATSDFCLVPKMNVKAWCFLGDTDASQVKEKSEPVTFFAVFRNRISCQYLPPLFYLPSATSIFFFENSSGYAN